MKKLVWLLVLVLSVSVVGCDKRDSENTESITTEATVKELESENANTEDRAETNLQDVAEISDLEILENDLLEQILPNKEIDLQGVSFVLSFAQNEMRNESIEYAVNEVTGVLSDFGFTVYDVSDDKKVVTMRQDISTPRGEILTYELVYGYDNEYKIFDLKGCELINYENDLVRELPKEKYHGEVITSNDEYNEPLIKLFETYLLNQDKTFRSHTFKDNYELNILDYVKVNLTNSNCDEYLVFISTGVEYDAYIDEIEITSVDVIKHFIFDNNNIIKVYDLSVVDIGVIYKYSTYRGPINFVIDLRFPSHEIRYEKDGRSTESTDRFYDDYNDAELGKQFQYGYISDFNQNGTNELYLSSSTGNYNAIEFDGQAFRRSMVINKEQVYPFEWWRETYLYGYDWEKGELYLKHDVGKIYNITIQWIPEDNCFRLIKYKIED